MRYTYNDGMIHSSERIIDSGFAEKYGNKEGNINRYLKSIGIKRKERIETIQEFEWKFYPLVQKAMGEGPAYCTGIGFDPVQILVLKNVFWVRT